jgi:hypothetical protein
MNKKSKNNNMRVQQVQNNNRPLTGEKSSSACFTDINVLSFVKDGEQKRVMGTSEKFVDVGATVTLAVAGAIVDLFLPTQGVGVSQRVGDSAMIKRMRIHYDVIDAIGPSIVTRIIIFQWHPSSAFAVPTVTDILQASAYGSFHEFATCQNYTVLDDCVFTQSAIAASPGSTASQALSRWVDIVPKKGFQSTAIFTPAATTGTNKIYMLRICSVASGATLVYNSRIIYTDT